MDTDIDWQRELDASFGHAPDEPIGTYVAAGHRAVRRRRAAAVVAGLGAAAVVAGVAWAAGPAALPSSGEAPIASDSRRSGATDAPWQAGDPPARFDGQGLEIREGAVEHERVDNLFPAKSTESVALDISYGGDRWWMSVEWTEDGSGWSGSATRPEKGRFASFDDFVVAEMRGGGMGGIEPAVGDDQWYAGLVRWTGDEPTPRTGVTVVREIPDPVPTAPDSLGLVLEKNGETTWLLITLDTTGSSASYVKASDSGWTTIDQWLVDQVALQEGSPESQPVRLDGGRVAAALPGVTVLEQLADPDLPAYGTATRGASSAVARIEWQGSRWFVFVLRTDGEDSVTTVAADKAGGAATLDEFVAFMADKADEGGMR